MSGPQGGEERLESKDQGGPITHGDFSPSGERFITAGADGTVRVWETQSGSCTQILDGHDDWVRECDFSSNGEKIATAGRDGKAIVWAAGTGEIIHVLEGHRGAVRGCSFSPDGKRLVTVSRDGTAQVWDTETGESVRKLGEHGGSVWGCSFSPNGERVVTAGQDGSRVWDVNTGEVVSEFEDHDSWVRDCAYSPDGDRILTAGRDGKAFVWDAETGQRLLTLEGHDGAIRCCVFSPDGDLIVTVSADETARVWNSENGERLRLLEGHDGWVWGCVFSPDSSQILTASWDGTARLWSRVGDLIYTINHEQEEIETSGWDPESDFGAPRIHASPDRPIETDNEDRLGYSVYADALAELILDERTEKPLTVLINGPWGSGKTSLANLMVQRLAPEDVPQGEKNVICRFNAWEYDDRDNLGRSLIEKAARTADGHRPEWSKLIHPLPGSLLTLGERVRRWVVLVGILALIALAGGFAIPWAAEALTGFLDSRSFANLAVPTWLKWVATGGLPALAAAYRLLTPAGGPAATYATQGDSTPQVDRQDVKESIRDLIDQATRPDRLFVIIVDDLERCKPPRSVDVLEAIKLFGLCDDLAVVLLSDLSTLASSVEAKYDQVARQDQARVGGVHEKIVGHASQKEDGGRSGTWERDWVKKRTEMAGTFGMKYVQKLVQVQFDIPPASNHYMQNLVADVAGTEGEQERPP